MEDNINNLIVLAINSFAVHGTASLKAVTKILGSRLLPVPSTILNGLTNMPGVSKFDFPFKELLESTFELAILRNKKLVLYIGYLGKPEQVELIMEFIERYRSHIVYIITDPICGDHGKAYIPKEIISKLPDLIKVSNIVFPNLTELKLILGKSPSTFENDEEEVNEFIAKFGGVDLVVTSILNKEKQIGINYYSKDYKFSFYHNLLSKNYGGSGDTYVALFIYYRFYKSLNMEESLKHAALDTFEYIRHSIEVDSDELILE